MEHKGLKVIIADDHSLFRQGVAKLLSDYDGFDQLIEAENGQQLLEKVHLYHPDVVLLDLNMPVMNGMTVMPILFKDYPQIKVIILSMYKDAEFIAKSIKEGASGYLLKDTNIDEVALAIKTVAEGKDYTNTLVSNALINQLRDKRKTNIYAELGVELSKQEKTLLKHIMAMDSNYEIADKMNLSVRTVEFYRSRLMQKLGVKNAAGLVAYAMKHILPE